MSPDRQGGADGVKTAFLRRKVASPGTRRTGHGGQGTGAAAIIALVIIGDS